MPEYRWWVAEPKWRAAEEYGFHHAWTYDHLGWRSLVDGPWFGAVPTLTAAAMVTSQIRLGTLVAKPSYRHPVSFVREVLALDDVSDGRFILGLGSGGTGIDRYDTAVFGEKPLSGKENFARYREFVEAVDGLLRNDKHSYSGEYYTAVDARNLPGCVQLPRVPFLLAGNGPRALRLAAKHGAGWVTTGRPAESPEEWWRTMAELSARFDEGVLAEQRDPGAVDKYLFLDSAPTYSLSSVEYFGDAVGRAADLGFTDVITHWPRESGVYAGSESVLEAVADEVLPELGRRDAGH